MCVCSRSITRIRLTRVAAAGGRLPIAPPVGGGSMSQYTQQLANYGHFILAAMTLKGSSTLISGTCPPTCVQVRAKPDVGSFDGVPAIWQDVRGGHASVKTPESGDALTKAVEFLEAGAWQQAHEIVQAERSNLAAWLHGIDRK